MSGIRPSLLSRQSCYSLSLNVGPIFPSSLTRWIVELPASRVTGQVPREVVASRSARARQLRYEARSTCTAVP